MASIKEVAQKAGVGVGTVSRVLNSTGYVSDETRIKVETAMKELNYIPNELARNLLSKKSGIVAIIIPKISHPFFAEVVLYAEAELMKKGYKTMICSTYSEQNYEKEYINMLNRHIVDGIIAGSHMLDFEEYQGVQGPIVALDRFLGENIPVVSTNHKIGGKLAAEELVRNNCRCVLQIQGARVVDSPSHERHYEFDTSYLDVRSSFMVTSIYSALIFVNSFIWNPFHFYIFYLFCTNSIRINCNTFFHVLFFIICRISQK